MAFKGPYETVEAKLTDLLVEGRKPNAEFNSIRQKVDGADFGMRFPDQLPVYLAKEAVKACLGPRLILDNNKLANAYGKLSSCGAADHQFFDTNGQLRAEYAGLKSRLDPSI